MPPTRPPGILGGNEYWYSRRMGAGRLVVAWVAAVSTSCATTERIDGRALADLGNGGPASRSLVLEDAHGQRIRLDPRSKVRLFLADGSDTPWLDAGQLSVTEDGWVVAGDERIHLDDINTVEVENIDGVRTYFLTLGFVVIAAALVALAVVAKEGPKFKGMRLGSASGSRVPAPRVRTVRPLRAPLRGSGPGRSNVHRYGRFWVNPPRGGVRPPVVPPTRPTPPTRVFTDGARRRSTLAALMQLEMGYGADPRTGIGLGIGVGLAIHQMFEVSAGLRALESTSTRPSALGYFRVGGNFPFEAADRFGAPIALDVAVGEQGFAHMRIIWGFRWRVAGRAEFAVLPVNPQMTLVDSTLYWDFPTTVQLGYRF